MTTNSPDDTEISSSLRIVVMVMPLLLTSILFMMPADTGSGGSDIDMSNASSYSGESAGVVEIGDDVDAVAINVESRIRFLPFLSDAEVVYTDGDDDMYLHHITPDRGTVSVDLPPNAENIRVFGYRADLEIREIRDQ